MYDTTIENVNRVIQVPGLITAKIGILVQKVIDELSNPTKYPLELLAKALETDPVAAACAQLKASRASQILGDYNHDNKEIQAWVRNVLKNTDDSLFNITAKLYSAAPFGFSMGEIWFDQRYNRKKREFEWILQSINPLEPSYVYPRTENGRINEIKYSQDYEKIIPYWKCVHVVNNLTVPFGQRSIFGNPEMARAYPFIKLKQLIFAEMGIAGKSRALGLLVGKTDSNTLVEERKKNGQKIIGANGKPKMISGTESLSRAFQGLDNHPYMVTDKQNEIQSLSLPSGERFWDFAKSLVDEQIMRSFLVPQLIWSEGSGALGLGALSNTQVTILDSSIIPIVQDIRDQLIDKVIKRLVIWNFGIQDNYGEFIHSPKNDPNQDSIITQTLLQAFNSGILSTGDHEALNAFRERMKLSPVNTEMQAFQAELQGQLARIKAAQEAEAQKEQQFILAEGQQEIQESFPQPQLPPGQPGQQQQPPDEGQQQL